MLDHTNKPAKTKKKISRLFHLRGRIELFQWMILFNEMDILIISS